MAYRPLPSPVVVVPSGIGADLMRRWMLSQGVEAFLTNAPAESRAEAWKVFDAIRAAASMPAADGVRRVFSDDETMLTADDAGKLLGCTGRRVRQLIDERSLDATKASGRWMIPKRAVEEYQNFRPAA